MVEDLDLVAVETRTSFYCAARSRAPTSVDELADAAAQPAPDGHRAARGAARGDEHRGDLLGRARRAHAPAGRARASPSRRAAGARSRGWRSAARRGARRCRARTPTARSSGTATATSRSIRPLPARARRARRRRAWRRAGCTPTPTARRASDLLFVRSVESWRRVARSWIEDPDPGEGADPVLGAGRQPAGVGHPRGHAGGREFRLAPEHPALLRLLARFALSYRPPTGFLRGLVVEHSGERRGQLDLKHGGIVADRRPRALGGDGGGRHQHLDGRAPARRRRRRDAARGRRAHAARGASS